MAIQKHELRFETDPSIDLPRLVDEEGRLTPQVRLAWEEELKARCNKQTLRAGETIQFSTAAKNFPSRFHIRAEPGPSNRMPTYVLEPIGQIPGSTTSPVSSTQPRETAVSLGTQLPNQLQMPASSLATSDYSWTRGFLADVQRLIWEGETDRLSRHGLELVLEELSDMAKSQPRELLVILVASYAAAGKLACADNPTQMRRGSFYDCALEALNSTLKSVATPASGGRFSALVGALSRRLGLSRGS